MFWGMVLQPNKKYSKTVQSPFRISHAVLDKTTLPDNEFVQLILKNDGVDHIFCKLRNLDTVQMPLNLAFCEGDRISIRCVGGSVHLTGFHVDDAPNWFESDSGVNEELTDDVDDDDPDRYESDSSVNEEGTDENDADERHSSDEKVQPPPAKVQKKP